MKKDQTNKDFLTIWKAVQNGNKAAFDQLYFAFVQVLFNYGIKLGARPEVVEDCIQELFITLWKNKAQLNISKALKPYFFQSLRRLILRKNQRLKTVPLEEKEEQLSALKEAPNTPPEWLSKENIASKKNLAQAIQRLPKRQKEAIFLKYYENLDYQEIASIMSIEVHSVYKLVGAGIKKLRTYLAFP